MVDMLADQKAETLGMQRVDWMVERMVARKVVRKVCWKVERLAV
jgi:hypothetical protein